MSGNLLGFDNKPRIKKMKKILEWVATLFIEMVIASGESKTISSFAVLQNKIDESLTRVCQLVQMVVKVVI